MDQKEFDHLLGRYLSGTASEAEKALVDHWYDSISPSVNSISGSEAAEIRERLQKALEANKNKSRSSREVHPPLYRAWAKFALPIAASIIVVAVTSLFFIADSVDRSSAITRSMALQNHLDWRTITNSTLSPQLIALDDGSQIMLAPGGVLEYPLHFRKQKREVRLNTGSAFFKIHREVDRPFYVYSSAVVTKVLGTSFCVNADAHGRVRVDVRTGTVMVSRAPEMVKKSEIQEVILRPNQRADYDPAQQTLVRTLVEKPRMIIPSAQAEDMDFEKASVAVILKAVEKAYEVDIQFDSARLSSCVLATHLIPEEDLYTRLTIICEAIDAKYRQEDGYILIEGKGCR